jgi:hypothetical protein
MAEPSGTREPYVARFPMKFSPGTNKDIANKESPIYLMPGDPLPAGMGETEVLALRQAGSVVPKSVWEALHAADTAVERARLAQEAAESEVDQQTRRTATFS